MNIGSRGFADHPVRAFTFLILRSYPFIYSGVRTQSLSHYYKNRVSPKPLANAESIEIDNLGEGEVVRSVWHDMKNAGKTSKGSGKSDVRKERKSGTGMNGSPKKGGHGGKYTWAGDGLSTVEIGFNKEVVDVKDPNFEDPDEITSD